MMSLVNLVAIGIGMLLSNKINECHGYDFREFENPPEWDIMANGSLYLHLVATNYIIPSNERGKDAATWLTRIICYGDSPNLTDIPSENCGIPGPTIVLHPNNEVQSVYLVNNLKGFGTQGHINTANEGYADPDVINLHVSYVP